MTQLGLKFRTTDSEEGGLRTVSSILGSYGLFTFLPKGLAVLQQLMLTGHLMTALNCTAYSTCIT